MKVSIIIPTLNEEKYIGSLLDCIDLQTHKPHEVIIVDAYSKDKTKEIALSKKVSRIVDHKPHVAHQRNMGAKLARGDILMFLDADVVLNERFIEKSINEFLEKNLDLACPVYVPRNSTLGVITVHKFLNFVFRATRRFHPSGAGCCIIVSKEVFDLHKGFSDMERYEDMEFIRRVGKKQRFDIIDEEIYISDRRWRKEGAIKLFTKYLLLSTLFLFGKFDTAHKVRYEFNIYDK